MRDSLWSVQALGVLLCNSCIEVHDVHEISHLYMASCFVALGSRQRLELETRLMLCDCNEKLHCIYMLKVGLEFFCF